MANRNTALNTLLVVGGCLATAFLLATLFVYNLFSPSRDEVGRVPSPSGHKVAVLLEINGGATTDFAYEVRVEGIGIGKSGSKVASLYGAIRSGSAYGVNLRWVSENELHIEYLTARSARLSRSWGFGPSIQVVLQDGILDSSAPPGGMLYNLRKRR